LCEYLRENTSLERMEDYIKQTLSIFQCKADKSRNKAIIVNKKERRKRKKTGSLVTKKGQM
jgi:hypothetical protein